MLCMKFVIFINLTLVMCKYKTTAAMILVRHKYYRWYCSESDNNVFGVRMTDNFRDDPD